ncbi:hypothetical protein KCU66_g17, partial [Aureobasidium melanogenum]
MFAPCANRLSRSCAAVFIIVSVFSDKTLWTERHFQTVSCHLFLSSITHAMSSLERCPNEILHTIANHMTLNDALSLRLASSSL